MRHSNAGPRFSHDKGAGTREYNWLNIGRVLGQRSHDRRTSLSGGEQIMTRSVLALGLLICLCASAEAARVRHSKPRDVIVRPSQSVDPRFPPVLQDQTPRYDDPSRRGSG